MPPPRKIGKRADAHRATPEKKIKELGEAIAFRTEAAERMSIIRRTKAKELADGRSAMEVCKSQAQIACDQYEKMTAQLKAAQNELAETKAALEKEKSQFTHHRRGNNDLMLSMYTWSLKIVEALAALGAKDPPILKPNHSHSLSNYLAFLEHVALMVRGAKESVSKVTRCAGEKAAQKVATQFVATLHQRCL